jgi:Cu/Ag efflux protein CusF
MRILLTSLIFAVCLTALACFSERVPHTPLETFKTYVKAVKKKDTTTMKLLLTSETLKAHEQEAKTMGTTVDDIIKRESLIGESQTAIEFRNEKIDGERATLEVKNSSDRWETIFFLNEGGEWKIDKKGSADNLLREIEEENRKADEQYQINNPPANNNSIPHLDANGTANINSPSVN